MPICALGLLLSSIQSIPLPHMGQTGRPFPLGLLANQYIALFQFCIMGISMGSSVLTARFWGAGDSKALKQTITIALRIALALSVAVAIITGCFATPIMGLYSKELPVITR